MRTILALLLMGFLAVHAEEATTPVAVKIVQRVPIQTLGPDGVMTRVSMSMPGASMTFVRMEGDQVVLKDKDGTISFAQGDVVGGFMSIGADFPILGSALDAAKLVRLERRAQSAAEGGGQFFIQNGVRRSLSSALNNADTIPAVIVREGQADEAVTLRLDQLFSPKSEVPLDSRFLDIQPPIRTPIEVQPLGVPGQPPSIPLNQVRLVPPPRE